MRGLVLVGTLAMWMPSTAEALCLAPYEGYVAINAGAAVPADGGLIIETTFYGGIGEGPPRGRGEWRVVVDTSAAPAELVTLAPGLEVMRLPANAPSAELRDQARVLGGVTRAAKAPPTLAAPKVTSIVHETWPGRRGNSTRVTVATSSVPDGAIAMVIADAKTGTVRSFGKPQVGVKQTAVYSQGRCSALPNGTIETRGGDRVVVRWVDRFGRLSPQSTAIKVGARKH